MSDIKIDTKKKIILHKSNNNEINIITKKLKNMGNFNDKCKKPYSKNCNETNIIFNCMSEEEDDIISGNFSQDHNEFNYKEEHDYDTDDFEEDLEIEYQNGSNKITVATVHTKNNLNFSETNLKHHSETCSSLRDDSKHREILHSIKHTDMLEANVFRKQINKRELPKQRNTCNSSVSSISDSRPRRINMSFTNDRSKEIHRQNHILMKKLIKTKSTRASTPTVLNQYKESNSAIARRRHQDKRDHENLILLRKIQSTRSFNLSGRK